MGTNKNDTPLLEVRHLKKYFKTGYGMLHAVDDINFTIERGTTLGVVGESGCGKSTLGRTILRLEQATDGEVLFEGENILAYNKKQLRTLRQKMQIIFQDPYSSLNPRNTVYQLIADQLIVNKIYKDKSELENRVLELMDIAGLAPRLVNSYPHELDGGRRQRIGLARALSMKPEFIVCDEPVSALDVSIQAQILNLLMDLQDKFGLTYLFITHDLSVVRHISDEIAVLYVGQCIEKAPSSELFKRPLHPYTKALFSAIPIHVAGFVHGAVITFQEPRAIAAKESKIRHEDAAMTAQHTFEDILGASPDILAAIARARRFATARQPVLIQGETGTGKELFAQSIHNASDRRDGPFVAINCANFNANTLESELFGYVEGAFTGAKKGGKMGLFEAANGGTLFLDEVSEMDYSLQAKLLRAIQEGRIRPVGGVEEIEVDVRLISASNADLQAYIEEGKFRRDLYYRLSTFQIHIPPLRERRNDIPALTQVILQELSQKLKRPITITQEALGCLTAHDWPGNVRELRNVLEFSAYLSDNGAIVRQSLPEHIARPAAARQEISLAQRVREFERGEIRKLLLQNGSDLAGKKRTAQQLGISLATLYNKLGE